MIGYITSSNEMMQTFPSKALKAELERKLGFCMSEFRRLKCVNSVNFKAVRASDGFAFTVKCLPRNRRFGYDLIVRHLDELRGTLAPQRVFTDECPENFEGYDLLCLAWCRGDAMFPDRLTSSQLITFLDDYLAFSEALQQTTMHIPAYPIQQWRTDALRKCVSGWGKIVLPCIEECREEESFYNRELTRIIHGDLHPGNFAFEGGRVTGFFDVEGLTVGYPAWDILRYFTFSIDHLRFYSLKRKNRIFELFAEAVRHLPYSRGEWIVSINATWLEQVYKKLCKPKVGLIVALQLKLHARLYRKLKEIVNQITV